MADRSGQDLLTKLSDRGEEALGKIAEVPGGARVAEAIRTLRDQVDTLQKRARGVDGLEAKITQLERRVAHLEGTKPAKPKPTAKRAAPKRAPAKRAPAPKPPASTPPAA
jgi:hypothetical protein